MAPLIELKNITVEFHQQRVLDNINVTINRKTITTLIGPNGAGKSTLIKVILGLQDATSGTIMKQKGLTIGYVPQKLKLNESLPLSVIRFLSLSGTSSRQELNKALSLVGADYLGQNSMHTLSGGEMQRILLARALLQRPDVLILDEPTQGVDVQGQIELYNLIDRLRQRFNCAVFMVSHDLHMVMAKTDHVLCLQHHICCSGTPVDVKQHPNYLALFGHTTHDAFALYQHHHGHHHHDLAGHPVEGDAETCCRHQHGKPHA